jgi:decaprenylphospho-beta-D-ribofuranose 2-oxidase
VTRRAHGGGQGHQGAERLLWGWGRTSPARSAFLEPGDADEVARLLTQGPPVIARGLGRSYGDAAQCAGGQVVSTSRLDHLEMLDARRGVVRAGAGVSLDRLMRRFLPDGWFVPVSPGTRFVSVGGAVAADIHGKNHHRDGSFCSHVEALTLATPSGMERVGPRTDPELFWATAGGMGLTGVVTEATFALTPVETTWMVIDTETTADLEALMATMEQTDHRYRYSVAWVDCMARGRHLGRGVLTRGDHARADDLPPRRRDKARAFPRDSRLRVPLVAPPGLVNLASVTAFNQAYRLAHRPGHGVLQSIPSFFHPLDGVADWNLLYGPRGFVQYQFAVDFAHGQSVLDAVTLLSESRVPSLVAVLKRFGPGDPGPLSFPTEGWTLALDLPVGPPVLPGVLRRLDELVAAAGGRVYLAKDARLAPDLVPVMYPSLDRLRAARRRVDPEGRLQSDLSRRLGLDAHTPEVAAPERRAAAVGGAR